jgi:hypothetical protein
MGPVRATLSFEAGERMILYVILMIYGGLSAVTLAALLYVVARHGNLMRRDERRRADNNAGSAGKVADSSTPSKQNGYEQRLDGQRRELWPRMGDAA